MQIEGGRERDGDKVERFKDCCFQTQLGRHPKGQFVAAPETKMRYNFQNVFYTICKHQSTFSEIAFPHQHLSVMFIF